MSKHSALGLSCRIRSQCWLPKAWAGQGPGLRPPSASRGLRGPPSACWTSRWPQGGQLGRAGAETGGVRQAGGLGRGAQVPSRGLLQGEGLASGVAGQARAPARSGHPISATRTSAHGRWCCLGPGKEPQGRNGSRLSRAPPQPLAEQPGQRRPPAPGPASCRPSPPTGPKGSSGHRPWAAAWVSVVQIYLCL